MILVIRKGTSGYAVSWFWMDGVSHDDGAKPRSDPSYPDRASGIHAGVESGLTL